MVQARADLAQQQAEEAKVEAEPATDSEEATEATAQTTEAPQAQQASQADGAAEADSEGFIPQGLAQATQAQPAQSNAAENRQTLGHVFGVEGDDSIQVGQSQSQASGPLGRSGGEDSRASDVVARAGRIESFYAASTRPRAEGFSSFA